ncbi:MAG: hypothetical protein Q9198_010703, partial [Flavoplaca austrocitrina]
MAASGIEALSKPQTNQADQYDHPISLVDTTKPKVDKGSSESYPESSGASLTRRWTRGTLRKELAKRKYAKWQQDRSHFEEDAEPTDPHGDQNAEYEAGAVSRRVQEKEGQRNRLSKKVQPASKEEQSPRQIGNQDSVIDILYENQR